MEYTQQISTSYHAAVYVYHTGKQFLYTIKYNHYPMPLNHTRSTKKFGKNHIE